MKRLLVFSLIIAMMLIASIAWSEIVYVNGTTGDDATGERGNPDKPFKRIENGLAAAQHGDTVLVAKGIYKGEGNRNLNFRSKIIEVRSENGPEYTIIDGENAHTSVFIFNSGEGRLSVVDGFTITGAGDYAIWCQANASPTIINNIIMGNSGRGINCDVGSSLIKNNIITQNDGGGIKCNGASEIDGNIIMNNTAQNGAGIYCAGGLSVVQIISNNTIIWNSATELGGGGICVYSSPKIINNTICFNTTTGSGGAIYSGTSATPTVLNTILWGNTSPEIELYRGTIYVTYSDVKGGWPGEGNIDSDPLFVDQGNGDYHLQSGSPCIDAGTQDGAPLYDLDGNPRDEFPDIGAYEYVGPSSIKIISPADGAEFLVGEVVDVLAEVRNGSGNPVAGVEVIFEAIGGTVDPISDITDANGQAITQLTVGEGENIVAAIITDDIFDTVTVIGLARIGSISGHVMDTVGRPVKFALVIAINSDTKDKYKTFTDSNGDYEMPELPAATYWVICIKKGYKAGLKKAEVLAGEATRVDFMLTPKLE